MSAKRKIQVQVGEQRATIYRWTHPGTGKKAWRFAYRAAPDAPWQYCTRPTQADAELAAEKKLRTLAEQSLDWANLSPERRAFLAAVHRAVPESQDDQAAVLASLAGRAASVEIAAAVNLFLTFKEAAKGHASAHLEQMRRDLEHLGRHFAGQSVADIQLAPLAAWWDLRAGTAGRHRKQGIRRSLVSFFLWARKETLTAPGLTTVAERLPSLSTGDGSLYVFSPDEFALLAHHVSEPFLPWLIFGAFCGLRPEEIAPKTATPRKPKPGSPLAKPRPARQQKPGLMWEHIDWQFNVIRLPKEVSKGGKRARIIPLQPVALAWLAHHGVDENWHGRVCETDAATAGETKRLGAILDEHYQRSTGWPDDALRHSYASYRNAVLRSLPQVAEEMGNSEAMLHKHYHNPKTAAEGEAWFSLDPAACSDKIRFLKKSGAEIRQKRHA
jgi:integrase